MNPVHRKAAFAILRTLVILLAAVFIPAWTFDYWQGWLCLACFFIPATIITVWVATHDPALLERRLKAGPKGEQKTGQKIVQAIASIVFLADFVVPAFDHRYGWSRVSALSSIIGALMMLIGFWIVVIVFRENSYTSGVIEVAEDQKVISTGPYALVRHPMYVGGLIMLFGIPLALGSWWGMLINVPMTAAIVWRLLDEEQFLLRELPAYAEYRNRVKFRLIPFVW